MKFLQPLSLFLVSTASALAVPDDHFLKSRSIGTSNFAGAVIDTSIIPSRPTISTVNGILNVPSYSPAPGPGPWQLVTQVGIQLNTTADYIRTGIFTSISGPNTTIQLFVNTPYAAVTYSHFTVNEGDSISISYVANRDSSTTVSVKNLSNQISFSIRVPVDINPAGSSALVQWETINPPTESTSDDEQALATVPVFTPFTFSGCGILTNVGSFGLSIATTYLQMDGSWVAVNAVVQSPSVVLLSYKGFPPWE